MESVALVGGIEASDFSPRAGLPIHAAAVMTLPDHHRDSFDRMVIAQATHEPMRLLTPDPALRPYTDLVDPS